MTFLYNIVKSKNVFLLDFRFENQSGENQWKRRWQSWFVRKGSFSDSMQTFGFSIFRSKNWSFFGLEGGCYSFSRRLKDWNSVLNPFGTHCDAFWASKWSKIVFEILKKSKIQTSDSMVTNTFVFLCGNMGLETKLSPCGQKINCFTLEAGCGFLELAMISSPVVPYYPYDFLNP